MTAEAEDDVLGPEAAAEGKGKADDAATTTEDETSRTASAFAQALQSMHRTGQP